MYQVLKKETLAPNIVFMRFEAPKVAQSARPGQFVIIRADDKGERIPMGMAGWDREAGTIDIVFYVLGTSTAKLAALNVGESATNIAGPLGIATEIEKFGTVICACGCFGIGPTIPLIKALKEAGNEVITVVEGRGPDFIFWTDRLREISDEVHVLTGCGRPGWADEFIEDFLKEGRTADKVFVHGCPFMMKVSSDATVSAGIKTVVSLTPIMVDGTGMCGACRVEVSGKTQFACVDGPDFDGHQVNWDGMVMRLRQFIPEEDKSFNIWERDNWHKLISKPHRPPNPEKLLIKAEARHHHKACDSQ